MSSAAASRRVVRVGDRVVAMNISISRNAGARTSTGAGAGASAGAGMLTDDLVTARLIDVNDDLAPRLSASRVASIEEFPALR